MKKGKFIVIDGTDGSGKATQTALLVEALKKKKVKVKKIDFPRYYDNFFGKLIGECLSGLYGDFAATDPHIASVLYAADRWESSAQIKKWLDRGYTIIADRYVSSNQIHQGGKLRDLAERERFLGWLDKMEHGIFKIPRPDAIVYLHLEVQLTLGLLKEKSLAQKKRYAEGRGDMVENNLKYLEDSRESAMYIVKRLNNWHQIECSKDGGVLSKQEIHDLVFKKEKKILKLK